MNGKQLMTLLEGIVSKLVREELKEQLPIILSQMARNNSRQQEPQQQEEEQTVVVGNAVKKKKKPSLFEILATDEEKEEYNQIPQPEANDDYGIYHDKMHKNDLDESRNNKLLNPETNPLAFLYEGMTPKNDNPGPPLHFQQGGGVNTSEAKKMQMLAGLAPTEDEDINKPIKVDHEKERMLEARRAQLRSIQVNTGTPTQTSQQIEPEPIMEYQEPMDLPPFPGFSGGESESRLEMAMAKAASKSKYRVGRY